jgi:hypothetical protein
MNARFLLGAFVIGAIYTTAQDAGGEDAANESVDLMDTAEDMAEAVADIPARDIKSKDDTTKVLGETVFKSGVEDMEELEAEVTHCGFYILHCISDFALCLRTRSSSSPSKISARSHLASRLQSPRSLAKSKRN